MKKMSRIIAIALLLSTVAVVLLAQPKGAPERMRAINPPGTPQGLPFSNGLLVGNTLYVAGEQGADANGKAQPHRADRRLAQERLLEQGEAVGQAP